MRKLFVNLSLLIVGTIILIFTLVIALLAVLLVVVADELLAKEILYIINERQREDRKTENWD
jgi:hypothetical protein